MIKVMVKKRKPTKATAEKPQKVKTVAFIEDVKSDEPEEHFGIVTEPPIEDCWSSMNDSMPLFKNALSGFKKIESQIYPFLEDHDNDPVELGFEENSDIRLAKAQIKWCIKRAKVSRCT